MVIKIFIESFIFQDSVYELCYITALNNLALTDIFLLSGGHSITSYIDYMSHYVLIRKKNI